MKSSHQRLKFKKKSFSLDSFFVTHRAPSRATNLKYSTGPSRFFHDALIILTKFKLNGQDGDLQFVSCEDTTAFTRSLIALIQ